MECLRFQGSPFSSKCSTDRISLDPFYIWRMSVLKIPDYRGKKRSCSLGTSHALSLPHLDLAGLQTTRLGNHLEDRVNKFLRRQNHPEAGEVFVRVVASSDKTVEVKPGMKSRCVCRRCPSGHPAWFTRALLSGKALESGKHNLRALHQLAYSYPSLSVPHSSGEVEFLSE